MESFSDSAVTHTEDIHRIDLSLVQAKLFGASGSNLGNQAAQAGYSNSSSISSWALKSIRLPEIIIEVEFTTCLVLYHDCSRSVICISHQVLPFSTSMHRVFLSIVPTRRGWRLDLLGMLKDLQPLGMANIRAGSARADARVQGCSWFYAGCTLPDGGE